MNRLLICGGALVVLVGASALGLSLTSEPVQEEIVPPPSQSLPAELPKCLEDLKPVPSFDIHVKPVAAAADPVKPVPAKEDLVAELIAILNTTESFDAFFIAVNLLEEIGADAKPAIPSIIRNAERLGAFKNHLLLRSDDTEMVERIHRGLRTIRQSAEEARKGGLGCVPCR